MSKKKSQLSLYKRQKRRTLTFKRNVVIVSSKKKRKPENLSTPRTTPLKRCLTPHSGGRKRTRVKSPYVGNELLDDGNWIDDDVFDERGQSDFKLFKEFKSVLLSEGLWDSFSIFFNLILEQRYPLDNIAFLLFLDTVKFYSCQTTSQMQYSNQTKRFWKAGYRLFHAKFLYFMGGPKNINQQTQENERRYYPPEAARINFAVPSVNTIESFDICDVDLPKKMPTGIIEPVMKSISNLVLDKRFMLCADAKKVTAGVDKVGGDVDMFGFEDGHSLSKRRERLDTELAVFDEVVIDLKTGKEPPRAVLENLRNCCSLLGKRIGDAREMKARQEYGLQKFMALGGEKWRESKYVYAISALHTSLFQLMDFIESALRTVHEICKYAGLLGNSVSVVPNFRTEIDQTQQANMISLNPDYESVILEPKFIKQRTPLWAEVRKMAPVTGSSIHSAIGLRGTAAQKKHISKLLKPDSIDDNQPNEEEISRMEYGTKNEENALATLAGVVLPTFFPSTYYVEEGCYISQGINRDALLVVSPDGSIREATAGINNNENELGDVFAAVEVKCPYPQAQKAILHYNLPHYYVCQCLAEMFVLKTKLLLYLSWSVEASVVLQVTFDETLWQMIWSLITDTYDNDNPKRHKDAGQHIKEIKKKISTFVKSHVKFIAEVPSLKSTYSTTPKTVPDLPYSWPLQTDHQELEQSDDVVDDIVMLVNKGKESMEVAYDLQRRKATEVMVWVLTHIDRNSSIELPSSMPIAFGLKDYKLKAIEMRKATEFVLQKCHEYGIQICTMSADGQWIQMMTRDKDGQPLTILQHQKDVWNMVQKISKVEIAKKIGQANKVEGTPDEVCAKIKYKKKENGVIEVTSKDKAFAKIKFPELKTLSSILPLIQNRGKKKSPQSAIESETEVSPEMSRDTADWIPQQLVSVIQDTSDNDIGNVIRGIDMELNNTATDSQDSQDGYNHESINSSSESRDRRPLGISTVDKDKGQIEIDDVVSDNCTRVVLSALQNSSTVPGRWQEVTEQELDLILSSDDGLSALTHKDLDIVSKALLENTSSKETVRRSWNKAKKVSFLKGLMNNDIQKTERKNRKKNPSKLSALCQKVIRSRQMPKVILNVVYANFIYDDMYENWTQKQAFSGNLFLGDEEAVPFWYAYPEKNEHANGLIGKSIDCSHNFTHLRVRSCTTGIGKTPPDAWKAVAKSNETHLNTAMVEDLIDKQSVPNARTNFSSEVEDWMRKHGFHDAADVTNVVRCWYEASDSPGLSAETRVEYLLRMRNFLLEGVDFGTFPPAGRYINKIPIVTFEGLLIDIDTKLQLHALIGPYNIRSVGSLAAETTVGILQQLNPTSNVSIKARDVPALMSSVVEVMTCKLNPDRGFFMRTSRNSGVYPMYELEKGNTAGNEATQTSARIESSTGTTMLRNHAFDYSTRKKARRKIKFGTVSAPSAPSRGALPVRQFHRKDESNILPSKRLGIDF